MKPPKEPKAFLRPRLYYQPTSEDHIGRLRLLVPRKRGLWWCDWWATSRGYNSSSSWAECCWGCTVSQMKAYDEHMGWPEAEFICEL